MIYFELEGEQDTIELNNLLMQLFRMFDVLALNFEYFSSKIHVKNLFCLFLDVAFMKGYNRFKQMLDEYISQEAD